MLTCNSMSENAKITLSAKELELVCNSDWILTKNNIISKVYQMFGELAHGMQESIGVEGASLPEEAKGGNPKISRGENYRGLPYVMLDYPRHFTKEATLAVRTMFWWGNFFSISLQVSGNPADRLMSRLRAAFTYLQNQDYWLCVNADPWQHHFEAGNYLPLNQFTQSEFDTRLATAKFIKVAKKIPLDQWEGATKFLEECFAEMLSLLQFNYQGGETGPSPGIPRVGSDL